MHLGLYFYNYPAPTPSDLLLFLESINFFFSPSFLHRPLGTSFKGKYGCVDYWVKAFLDRPSQPTQEAKKNFEVMDLVDVNTPDLMVRVPLRF